MADDRAAESEVEQVARLARELADLRSTVLARVSRRPTGDVEPSIRSSPKPDTLFLAGQLVSRAGYPVLWQWVADQGLVVPGLFTAGDGSTTFGLPDFRGRVLVGAGTLGAETYALGQLVGASTRVLTVANLPAHDHGVAVAAHAQHSHTASTDTSGNHGNHIVGGGQVASGSFPVPGDGASANGNHTHGVTIGNAGPTTHSVTEASVGSGAPVDVRQPGIALNWLVWT